MCDILGIFGVFVPDLVQVEEYIVGSLFGELFGIVLEGGRWGGEGALFGDLRHASFEFEEEGGEEGEF